MTFLERLLNSDELHTQLARLRYLDHETKSRLKDTILGNEPLMAYFHIISWIETPALPEMTGPYVFQGCNELV